MWITSLLRRYLLLLVLLFLCPSLAPAVDISLQTGQCIFGTADIYCEGTTADTIESVFAVTDPTASDKTFTFPDLSGIVALQSAAGFTNGSIPFYTSSQLTQDNAALFWDAANDRLGVGTTAFNSDSRLEVAGHITTEGTAPTLSACGSMPTVVGNDAAGTITIGTGVTTACTVTFAAAYANTPACVITGDNTLAGYSITARSTMAFTFASAVDMDSDVIAYICIGRG